MIGFIGLSHLGLTSSIAIASKGFKVTAVDADASLIFQLKNGKLPVHEPELDALLSKSVGNIAFTDQLSVLEKCQVIYIARDVPTDENNISNLSAIDKLIDSLVPHLGKDATLVVLSQVSPGFTRKLAAKYPQLNLYYQVETLIFGRAVERALYPERYIVGCAAPDKPLPAAFQELLAAFGCPVLPMRYESAELAKIAINCCLVSSISVANTLAEICETTGADWSEIVPALKLDKRIGQHSYLAPGLGIAGGNLERDLATLRHLSSENGTDYRVINSWIESSRYRRDWALRAVHREVFAKQAGAKLGVWGVAYKENTHSIKNSPAVAFMQSLRGQDISAYDPQAIFPVPEQPGFRQLKDPLAVCKGADALVILTPWPEFKEIPPATLGELMSGKTIIDPYKVLNGEACRKAGLKYLTLGKAEQLSC